MLKNTDAHDLFKEVWGNRRKNRLDHGPQAWDKRADVWEKELREDKERIERSKRRINATVEFLISEGALNKDSDVIDIGCGPGRFTAEFAKHCHSAVGIDISPKMVEYGNNFAAENGLSNVNHIALNFNEKDPAELGWTKKFDLVFASITPAMSTPEDLDKMESISKGFCFSSNFVKHSFLLKQQALAYALPEFDEINSWDGRSFYSMFNLLWLRGRYPKITYFNEYSEDRLPADRDLVNTITSHLPEEAATPEVLDKVYRYITEHADKDGMITYPIDCRYGWMLWDVRDDLQRKYFL